MAEKNIEERIFHMHAEVCKSLANPTRLKIMNLLRDGEMSVEELRRQLKLSKANLSQHLGILRQRMVVSARKAGLNVYYRIVDPQIVKACDILRKVLLKQLQEGSMLAKGMKKRGG